jgi:uncharacterized protein YjbI with pentapeptide repeats
MSPFESFDALLRAHFALRRSVSKRDATAIKEQIHDFIREAPEVGAILNRLDQRKVAQSILDYWVAQLIVLAPDEVDYSESAVLAEPKSPMPSAGSDKPEITENKTPDYSTKLDEDKIDKIRLVAAARLWESKGRDKGYLLFGKAIEDASKFRSDPDIDNLVAASEAYESNRRRLIAVVAGTLMAAFLVVLGLQFFGLPLLQNFIINGIIRGQSNNKFIGDVLGVDDREVISVALGGLSWIQYWLPPFDLSGGAVRLVGNELAGLKLYAPNFSSASLKNVTLKGASLESASFSGGDIDFSNFKNANLNTSQFKRAKIFYSSFGNAKLYRAIFDKSCLDRVDFSGADLLSASFSGAYFYRGENLKENFRNTAWWLAYGWNSEEIKALLLADQSGLAQSETFKFHAQSDIDKINRARAGTREQAEAVNRLAWTMATWGVSDLGATRIALKSACVADNKQLTGALEIAEDGICIAQKLNLCDVSNFRDTKAYVLIQQGKLIEAYEEYRGLVANDTRGDRLFRAAVVAAALGKADPAKNPTLKAEASANLDKSLAAGYFPSHELQTLKNDIPQEFWDRIYPHNDELWPDVKSCERPNSDAIN